MMSHRTCAWLLWTCLGLFGLSGCGAPSDPNAKDVAEFVLQKGGTLSIAGSSLKITSAGRLPQDAFAITEIDLNRKMINDEDLKHLTGLMHLTVLELHSTRITDDGLVHLANLPALTRLELSYTGITDTGLEQLAQLKGLQKLYLSGTDQLVSNEALVKLRQKLPECEIIRL